MKIAFSSAQCCGKTTLIKELIKTSYLKSYHIFDSPTRYLKQVYDIGFDTANSEVQLATLALQLYHVNQYEDAIFDRSVIDNLAYYFYHKKRGNSNMSKEAEYFMFDMSHEFMKHIDLTFVLIPEFPIVADGTRTVDEAQRQEIVTIMNHLLPDWAYDKYKYITGHLDKRIEKVVAYCKELKGEHYEKDEDIYYNVASMSKHSS
jgi:GTPase SAR1 family protein